MERSCLNLKEKIKAFTLLECLVALLAISGSVLVISGLTNLIVKQIQATKDDQTKDWQIFCEQMRSELAGSKFEKVEENFLYIDKDKGVRFGLVGSDFRKTSESGQGYQPMLYHLKNVKITETGGIVSMQIDFNTGGERTFIYRFLDVQ